MANTVVLSNLFERVWASGRVAINSTPKLGENKLYRSQNQHKLVPLLATQPAGPRGQQWGDSLPAKLSFARELMLNQGMTLAKEAAISP